MTLQLVWLADVLRAAGCHVVEAPGWKSRGRPVSTGGFAPRAVIWHHDASGVGASPNEPGYLVQGRPPSTPGPLCHAWVGLDGTWHTIAAGRANHAGLGDGWGVIPSGEGNTYAVGIETDHTTGERWPNEQLDALRVGTAAILTRLDALPGNALCGHKEYAPGRKTDPAGLNLDHERSLVETIMGDDVAAKDVWDYKLTNEITGGSSAAGAMLTKTHRRVNDLVKLVAAQQGTDQAAIEAALKAVLGSLND